MDNELALYTFGTGENNQLQDYLGVHRVDIDHKTAYVFRVWAPNAEEVSLIGDFTDWKANPLSMFRHEAGVWEVTTPLAKEGDIYKYLIKRQGGHVVEKIDPLAVLFEARPGQELLLKHYQIKNGEIVCGWGEGNALGLEKDLLTSMRSTLILGRRMKLESHMTCLA